MNVALSTPYLNSLLLLMEAALYFGVMASLLRVRKRFGVGLFMSALGVMHFIETYLASSFYVELPLGILSPGSTVLFSGKLIMLLLLYIKEDATTVRQPIYGLLIGNFLVLGLVGILGFHEVATLSNNRAPDIGFVQEMGWLMVWGTTLLYIDAIAIILALRKIRQMVRAGDVPAHRAQRLCGAHLRPDRLLSGPALSDRCAIVGSVRRLGR